jgi:fructose-1,6-bisphosphatase I
LRHIDECLADQWGSQADFNMRWISSLVAESLNPGSRRRALYQPIPPQLPTEGFACSRSPPMALVMEWAVARPRPGGGASGTGAKTPHQRVPLIMGSVVACDVAAIHEASSRCSTIATAPRRRGLFL